MKSYGVYKDKDMNEKREKNQRKEVKNFRGEPVISTSFHETLRCVREMRTVLMIIIIVVDGSTIGFDQIHSFSKNIKNQ